MKSTGLSDDNGQHSIGRYLRGIRPEKPTVLNNSYMAQHVLDRARGMASFLRNKTST